MTGMEDPQVSEVLPDTVAQLQKVQSNFDPIAALDRL